MENNKLMINALEIFFFVIADSSFYLLRFVFRDFQVGTAIGELAQKVYSIRQGQTIFKEIKSAKQEFQKTDGSKAFIFINPFQYLIE